MGLVSAILSGCFTSYSLPDGPAYEPGHGWVVAADRALQLIGAGAVTVLDVRPVEAWSSGHLAGAWRVDWRNFSESAAPLRGQLLGDDPLLERLLRAAGVSGDRKVLVMGDTVGGWGEDGRIVWMLRSLGHTDAALIDGGAAALEEAGVTMTRAATPTGQGAFTINRTARWSIGREALRALVSGGAAARGEVILVDTRERREYDGATPYGERRGGHLPGAIHLHYSALLDSAGRLRDRETLQTKLEQAGVPRASAKVKVITYCSGGVRSAWVAAVLTDLGHADVANYAGSMWEWSSLPAASYPLER